MAKDDYDSDEEPKRRKKEVNPHDAKWLVGQGGEQGYYDTKNEWVTTGWHDGEGYWFEACGEFDRRGKWKGTGMFDVWCAFASLFPHFPLIYLPLSADFRLTFRDPDGDWYETGYYDENEEWIVQDAFYDEEGDALELEKELRHNLPGGVQREAPEWKPPVPVRVCAHVLVTFWSMFAHPFALFWSRRRPLRNGTRKRTAAERKN